MQAKQNIPMPGEDNNAPEYFGLHKDKKYILNQQDIEGDCGDLVGKSSDTRIDGKDGLSKYTSQVGLLASEWSSSLKEMRFSEQKFPAGKPI